MSLRSVLEKLYTLSGTGSTNLKVELLKEYLEDPLFLKVVKYALTETLHFNIQKLPPPVKNATAASVNNMFAKLASLSKQSGASDLDKTTLAHFASVDQATWEVCRRIVNKDLKCGASAKLVNKAKPGTIRIMPYMRCSTEKKIDRIKFPAYIQEKADGMFTNLLTNDKEQMVFITRNGQKVHQLGALKTALREGIIKNSVFMGELLVRKYGKILDRKTGNGILNQCIQGKAKQEDADCVIFKSWDWVDIRHFWAGKSTDDYRQRMENVLALAECTNDKVDMIETHLVDSLEEAQKFYRLMREQGKEGAILKNRDTIWKDHTSPNQVKMKNVEDGEFLITGWELGKPGSKYEDCLGAIQIATQCGKLKCSVGSGFSDEQRLFDWEKYIGSICTVEFESIISDKNRKTKSLYLPRFIELRQDRSDAQTLKDLETR